MKVIIGVGVPGCGKTTYLRPVAEWEGLAYLNADEIREEITGDASNHSKERAVWGLFHRRLINHLRSGEGAVVDATYSKSSDRKRLVRVVRENGATEVLVYWFNIPLETCLRRNSERKRKVPEDVIRAMHERIKHEPPILLEGFDAIAEFRR